LPDPSVDKVNREQFHTQGTSRSVWNLFRHNGRLDWPVVVLFIAINLLIAINTIWHHPKIGYDVVDNITYIQVLWHRLPGPGDTGEFFSPPLPFALPAVFDKFCSAANSTTLQPFNELYISQTCRTRDGKFAQTLNLLLSLGSTVLVLAIAARLRPDSRYFRLAALTLLAGLTVYYKTFAQVRAEPYVVFFVLLSVFLIFLLLESAAFNWKLAVGLGVSLGCLVLSRQWGFFLIPAIGLFAIMLYLRDRDRGRRLIKALFVSGAVSLLVGGIFYFHLYRQYGSFTAFNINRPSYPSMQQAYALLRKTHLGDFELFRDPVRPAFTGAILPILYSETWGDYWGYFTYIKLNSSYGENGYSNTDSFVSYLGRVNLVSVPMSLLLGAALIFSLWEILRFAKLSALEGEYMLFVCLAMMCMLLGFGWFVYSYVLASTKVVKATYMLQVLVLLVFPAAELLERIRTRWPVAYWILLAVLLLAFVHNMPAMITRYNVFAFWHPANLINIGW
jgi:hypothetical protein